MTTMLSVWCWLIYLISLLSLKFSVFIKMFIYFLFTYFYAVIFFVYYNPIICSIIFLLLAIIYLLFYKNTFEFCLIINKFFILPYVIVEKNFIIKKFQQIFMTNKFINLFFEENMRENISRIDFTDDFNNKGGELELSNQNTKKLQGIKRFSFIVAIILFLFFCSIYVLFFLKNSHDFFIFVSVVLQKKLFYDFNMVMGIDALTIFFLILNSIVFVFIFLSINHKKYSKISNITYFNLREFCVIILLIELFLMLTFYTLTFFWFFFFLNLLYFYFFY